MMYILEAKELLDIIEAALANFAHSECPECGKGIGLEHYIDRADIEKWLKAMVKEEYSCPLKDM